jgi:hypothetical protein
VNRGETVPSKKKKGEKPMGKRLVMACDLKTMLTIHEDGAKAICPGEGE